MTRYEAELLAAATDVARRTRLEADEAHGCGSSLRAGRRVGERPPPDLPRHRERQLADELELARILVRREAGADMELQLVRELGAGGPRAGGILPGDHEGLDDLPAQLVGDADDRGRDDRWMLRQAVLDLERGDAVAGRDDHVVGAALEPQVAVGVASREVAGSEPRADELRRRRFGGVQVLEERDRVGHAHRDLAGLARGQLVPVAVDHRHVVSRVRQPHRAGTHLPHGRRVPDEVVRLGLPVDLRDGDAEALARPGERVRAERLAAAHDGAQRAVGQRHVSLPSSGAAPSAG